MNVRDELVVPVSDGGELTLDEGNVFDAVPPPQDAPPPPPSAPTPRAPRQRRKIGKGCLSILVTGFVLTLGGCTTVLLLASLGAIGDPVRDGETNSVVSDAAGNQSDADGSRWNVTLSPLSDVTDVVVGANGFNEPPPDGVAFAGFNAEMTLISANKEPLSVGVRRR